MDIADISIILTANKLDASVDIRRCDTKRKQQIQNLIKALTELKKELQNVTSAETINIIISDLDVRLIKLWEYYFESRQITQDLTIQSVNERVDALTSLLKNLPKVQTQQLALPKDEIAIIVQGVIRKLLTTWSSFANEQMIVKLGGGIYSAFYQGQAQESPEAKQLIAAQQYLTAEEYQKIINYVKTSIEQTYKNYNVTIETIDPKWYWFKLWGSSRLVKTPEAYDQRLYCNVQVKYLPQVIHKLITTLCNFLTQNKIQFLTGDIYIRGKIAKDEAQAVDRVDPLVLYFAGNDPVICARTYEEVVRAINTLPQEYTNQAKNALGKKEGLMTMVPDVTPQQFNIAKQVGFTAAKISYGEYVSLALAYAIIKTYNFSTFKRPIDENDLIIKTMQGIPKVKSIIQNTFLLQFN